MFPPLTECRAAMAAHMQCEVQELFDDEPGTPALKVVK
jgi:hypothetical protein